MTTGWKDRLATEQKELKAKIKRLEEFMLSNEWESLDDIHQSLLSLQRAVMRQYDYVLTGRVNLF